MLRKIRIITVLYLILSLIVVQTAFADSDTEGGILPDPEQPVLSPVTDNLTEDRVYLFSLKNSVNSEMILVESNGHYGLIDSSYRSTDFFTGMNGYTVMAPVEMDLSNPTSNGLNNAKYMIDTLGVTHLDFVIGTHSHSDHIGGIPEIAELEYNGVDLIDSDTVYFCKNYKSIDRVEDVTWADPEFSFAAEEAIREAGGKVLHVNKELYAHEVIGSAPDHSDTLQAVNETPGLSGAEYDSGNPYNAYDDTLSFYMGDLKISLLNLFSTDIPRYTTGENVNSIVTLITKGEDSLVSLADLTIEQGVAQEISRCIYDILGGNRVTFLIDAHHGASAYSNSLEEADNYRPVYDLRCSGSSSANGSYFNFISYLSSNYGTRSYSAGDNEGAIVCDLTDGADIHQIIGTGETAYLAPPQKAAYYTRDGWHSWDYDYKSTDVRNAYWTYYTNGSLVYGWKLINGEWYYFRGSGLMAYDCWLRSSGHWYRLDSSGSMIRSAWFKNGGNWYYLKDDGQMASGWTKVSNHWYYLNGSGVMQTGWLRSAGKWYYLNSSGVMQTGWQKIDGKWYYFNSSGVMQTGWIKVSGKSYYLDSSGVMITGLHEIDGKHYYFLPSGELMPQTVKKQ